MNQTQIHKNLTNMKKDQSQLLAELRNEHALLQQFYNTGTLDDSSDLSKDSASDIIPKKYLNNNQTISFNKIKRPQPQVKRHKDNLISHRKKAKINNYSGENSFQRSIEDDMAASSHNSSNNMEERKDNIYIQNQQLQNDELFQNLASLNSGKDQNSVFLKKQRKPISEINHNDYSLSLSHSNKNSDNGQANQINKSQNPFNSIITCSTNKLPNLHRQILENNYLKIQELLLKQRSLQQQSHALQEQNQALLADYRSIKEQYYKKCQQITQHQMLLDYLLKQLVPDVLLQNLVRNNAKDKTGKQRSVKTVIEQEFQKSSNRYFTLRKLGKEDIDCFYKKVKQILAYRLENQQQCQNDFVKHQQEIERRNRQIEELNEKVERVQKMTSQESKKLQKHFQDQLTKATDDNTNLRRKILSLQSQLQKKEQIHVFKVKKFQEYIVELEMQVKKNNRSQIDNDDKIEVQLRKLSHLENKLKSNSENQQKLQNKVKKLTASNGELESVYRKQIQVNKSQNFTIMGLNQQISRLNDLLKNERQSSSQTMGFIKQQEQSLRKQIQNLKMMNKKQQEISKQQKQSLTTHINTIKTQLDNALRVQQNFTNSQQRYKQLCGIRQNWLKMNNHTDHLWSVKEIQYENIMDIINTFK